MVVMAVGLQDGVLYESRETERVRDSLDTG